MMELQDILKIDQEPFDEETLKLLHYQYSSMYYQNILGCLIMNYFYKFSKEYQVNLSLDKWTMLIRSNLEEEDDSYWYESSENLFLDSLECFGWENYIFLMDPSEFEYSMNDSSHLGTEGSKKGFHACLEKWIEKYIREPEVKKIILKQEDTLYDATYYMDERIIFIYWNDKLSEYLTLRKKNPERVYELCGKEDEQIRRIEVDIWFPFLDAFDYEKGEEEGLHYSILMLGSDGYSYHSLDGMDPNWICRAFVLNELLDLALSKLRKEELVLKYAV